MNEGKPMKSKRPDILLCFTDGNELHIAIGALILRPLREIVLIAQDLPSDYTESIESLLKDKGVRCPITLRDNYRTEDRREGRVALLVNHCTHLLEYKILFEEVKNGGALYFADVTEGEVYSLESGDMMPVEGGPVELEVDEVLEMEGFNIEKSTEDLMNSQGMSDLIEFIQEDTHRWDDLRHLMKNNTLPNGDWLQFGNRLKVEYTEDSPMGSFVAFLEKRGYIKERIVTRNRIHLKIPDDTVRSFIQTTGLWLEALTYRTIHGLPFIDDTKAAVRFLWGHAPCGVVNEIDVMATSDSRMIFVSCKDIDNPSTSMLNELEVYAQRIGGSQGIKLMITSKKPHSHHFFERAKAMGIHIVWWGHDIKAFTDVLNTVLTRELN